MIPNDKQLKYNVLVKVFGFLGLDIRLNLSNKKYFLLEIIFISLTKRKKSYTFSL